MKIYIQTHGITDKWTNRRVDNYTSKLTDRKDGQTNKQAKILWYNKTTSDLRAVKEKIYHKEGICIL